MPCKLLEAKVQEAFNEAGIDAHVTGQVHDELQIEAAEGVAGQAEQIAGKVVMKHLAEELSFNVTGEQSNEKDIS